MAKKILQKVKCTIYGEIRPLICGLYKTNFAVSNYLQQLKKIT